MAKNLDKLTKAELIEMLRNQDKELKEAKAAAQGVVIGAGEKDGYLVTTPLASYSGRTAGVLFRGGRAFIEAVPEVEAPEEPGKDPEADGAWKAYIRHTELLSSLEKDFGYTVTRLNEEGIEKLRTEPVGDEMVRETIADKIVMPSVME